MNSFTRPGCSLALLSMIPVWALAQFPDQYVASQSDSAAAYWRLRTAADDQSPTAEFYNAHHQLLYTERLPASARHINLATRRALDRFLLHLERHQLLTTSYLTPVPEVLEPTAPAVASAPAGALRHVVFRKGTAVLSVEPVLAPSGSLVVNCAQSANRWLLVILADAEHQQLVGKRFKTSLSKLSFRLTQLPSGQYYLKAGWAKHPVIYRVLIDDSKGQYSLQNEHQ